MFPLLGIFFVIVVERSTRAWSRRNHHTGPRWSLFFDGLGGISASLGPRLLRFVRMYASRGSASRPRRVQDASVAGVSGRTWTRPPRNWFPGRKQTQIANKVRRCRAGRGGMATESGWKRWQRTPDPLSAAIDQANDKKKAKRSGLGAGRGVHGRSRLTDFQSHKTPLSPAQTGRRGEARYPLWARQHSGFCCQWPGTPRRCQLGNIVDEEES